MDKKTMYIIKKIRRYNWAIGFFIFIIVFLSGSVCYYGELKPLISAIGALLSAIPFNMFWRTYNSPILEILSTPEYRIFHTNSNEEYSCCRIIIRNNGISAAKNCKGYITNRDNKERVCWTIPKERPNATINSKDNERLDFCAFLTDKRDIVQREKPKLITPTEEGWKEQASENRQINCQISKVLITAENADPIEAEINFNLKDNKIEIKVVR